MNTSSTFSGESFAWSMAARIAVDPSCVAVTLERDLLKEPIGVRLAERMTTRFMMLIRFEAIQKKGVVFMLLFAT